MAQENITYHMQWLGPSTIIPNMKLEDGRDMRNVLSRGGICYMLHLRSIHEDLHQLLVSRDRALLENPLHSQMIYLTQEQFSQLIPWDRSLEYYSIEELQEQIHAHVALVLGDSDLDENSNSLPVPPSISQKRFNPHGLPPVFVSCDALAQAHRDMQEEGKNASGTRRGIWAWRQISWLRAILFLIRARQKKSWIPRWMKQLEKIIKQVLGDPNSFLEKILSARPIWRDDEQIGLRVRVDFLFG